MLTVKEGRTHVLTDRGGCKLVAGAVHTHTTASDGQYAANELVALAHDKGLGVLCITDHHANDWRYRLGLKLSRPSVMSFGVREYFDSIRSATDNSLGPIVLGGIEIMPHYRWTGIPPFLTCEAMKTLVVYGVDDPSIIETLPVHLDGKGKSEAEGRQTAQKVIDHVRARGGMAYWSHLEVDEKSAMLTAKMRYRPRPELLTETAGYTGFGCFPQGYQISCRPGGSWALRLAAAIENKTYDGPWVIGEADYHSGDQDEPYRNICNPVTVFMLKRLESSDVLSGLATGQMYAYLGHHFGESLLESYRVSSDDDTAAGESGQTVRTDRELSLHLKVSGFEKGCRLRVICKGKILKEENTRELTVTLPRPEGNGYACRAEAASPDGERIMTNPIFVAPEPEESSWRPSDTP